MQSKKDCSQQEKLKLIKRFSNQYQGRCILFRQFPNEIVTYIKKQVGQSWLKLIQNVYAEITGNYNLKKQQNIGISQQNLFRILRNIILLKGQKFYGKRQSGSFLNVNIQLSLNQINNISFKTLKYLYFNKCHLTNAEALSFLDMPNLQKLHLEENQIVSLRSFSKTSFVELKQILLKNNMFTYHSFNNLSRFQSLNIELIQIDQKLWRFKLQDLKSFFKFKIDSKKWKRQKQMIMLKDQYFWKRSRR